MLHAVDVSRESLREEMRCTLEAAARNVAPGVFEFITWPRVRPSELDDARLRALLGVDAEEQIEYIGLDELLEKLPAKGDALRRLRRVVRSNLMDVRVVVSGDVTCIIGIAPTGGMAGFCARMPNVVSAQVA